VKRKPRLDVAVFTPLPPVRSGIAAFNASFLPLLAEHVDVSAFVDDRDFPLTSDVPGISIGPVSSFDRGNHDLAIFHMGNHGPYHEFVYRALCTNPGLTVLHDVRMTDFFRWLEAVAPGDVDLRLPRVRPDAGGPSVVDVPSLEPLVDRSRVLLVHSNAAARRLRAVYPAAAVLSFGLVGPAADSPASAPAPDFGWPVGALVVGALGGIARHKDILRLVPLVEGLRRAGVDVRLVVAGWIFDAEYLAEIEQEIVVSGIEGSVRILTDVTDSEMTALIDLCDVTIDLRYDFTGSSSMSLVSTLARRTPAIVLALPEFSEIDHPLLILVTTDPIRSVAECSRVLAEMSARKRRGEAVLPALGDTNVDFDRIEESTSADAIEGYLQAIEIAIESDDPIRTGVTMSDARRLVAGLPGVTVVGNFLASTGLMQFGRTVTELLQAAGVPLEHFEQTVPGLTVDATLDVSRLSEVLPRRREAAVELWLANINEFTVLDANVIRPAGPRRHVIGAWFWELPALQAPFAEQFLHLDEVWVGSPFIARTFRQYTDLPITVVPMPISPLPDETLSRADFGIPERSVVYFYDFDANSHPARKNPLGLVAAFRKAFPAGDRDRAGNGAVLVIKARNLGLAHHSEFASVFRQAVENVGGILIAEDLDRRSMDSLLAHSDVYVSMHRAEGLGIGMLEAMHLGKPVISPAYPQKWIFPASSVGLATPSPLRRISEEDVRLSPASKLVYTREMCWTEPSADRTIELMRLLFDEPDIRRRAGERASRVVRRHYSPARSLEVMIDRLRSVSAARHPHVNASAAP